VKLLFQRFVFVLHVAQFSFKRWYSVRCFHLFSWTIIRHRSDIDRLEDAFVNALFKLEQATTNNKNEIIVHIKSLSMPNDSSTEKMKTSDTISSLETKLRNMKDENKSLEQQLHIFIVGSCLFKLEKCIYECIFQPVNVWSID
jgi:hypothetical protein